ncbi:MAG: DegV family protein [Candidatus Heimdallarchaeota archaeon]|nr:DegV family protein [Candidatus Heimdallarchaeota archaeon]
MGIRFVTDSGSDIDLNYADEIGVKVVPLSVTFSDAADVEHKEDSSFDLESYYNKYTSVEDFFAKTAQPSPNAFFEAYESLVDEGTKEIIVVTLSSGLSGTINSARLGANMLKKKDDSIKIHLVDALNASYSEVLLIEKGIELREQGKSGEEISKLLREHTKNIKTYILLPSLIYLRKGGRISVTKYILGRLLRKRPITVVNSEGKNDVATTVTETEEGIHKILELTTEKFNRFPKQVVIIHGNSPERADLMEAAVKKYIKGAKITKRCTGVTISAHTGPDVVALISEF